MTLLIIYTNGPSETISSHCYIVSMAIRVVEFSNGVYKIEKILHKNKHTPRKLLNFDNRTNGESQ